MFLMGKSQNSEFILYLTILTFFNIENDKWIMFSEEKSQNTCSLGEQKVTYFKNIKKILPTPNFGTVV